MYHIHADPRCGRSAEKLYKALVELLAVKSFDQISVSDLQRKTGIGRSTFYRNFDCLLDILLMKFDHLFEQMLQTFTQAHSKIDLSDEFLFIRHVIRFWHKNSEILELLIKVGRLDVIFRSLLDKMSAWSQRVFKTQPLNTVYDRHFAALRAGQFVGILVVWLEEGKKETSDEVVEIIRQHLRHDKAIQFF